jgi:hypothetical protein
MTILFFILCLVFGFFAFRHFRNGRFIWGVVAAFGSLLMAGSVWVDYQRATGGASADTSSDAAKAPVPAQAGPEIRDYVPSKDGGEGAPE